MAKLPVNPFAWPEPDRRSLYRALLVLTHHRLSDGRFRVARHVLLTDLEIYDDPRQGVGSWLFPDEEELLNSLGEQLQPVDPQALTDDDRRQVRQAAAALRDRLEANGTGRPLLIPPRMAKVDDADRPGRFMVTPKAVVTRLGRWLLILLVGLFFLCVVGIALRDIANLGYLAFEATIFDAWSILNLVSAVFSTVAVAGAVYAIVRRRLISALVFLTLALPTQFVSAATSCDVLGACGPGWAALPASAFDWRVRIRPVTDENEAERIASAALSASGSEDSPYKAKRFGDHWIVSTIDDDGWPGARAVRIDARTTSTKLVPCPTDKIQCGMERPIVSDGLRVFRNDQLGLAATFPRGRSVCTARNDDDEPRGFFAMVREPDTPCELLDDSRLMGVEIPPFRRKGCKVTEAPSLAWRELSPATAKLFRNPPTLGGAPSIACEHHQRGYIEISVSAVSAPPSVPVASRAAGYEGYIVTTPAHLAEDIELFEAFLRSVRIGVPG